MLSGAGERFRRYAPGLKARGINLHVITISEVSEIQKDVVDEIEVLRLPLEVAISLRDGRHSASAPLLREARQFFKKNNYRPDILHILSHTLEGAPDVWKIRWQGIPCVQSITMMPKKIHQPGKWLKVTIHQWLRYSPFDYIVTNSNIMSNRIRTQGVSSKRIKTIPNGVDLNRFCPTESQNERLNLRKKLSLDANARIILYVGQIKPRKGTDLLIDAWKEIAKKIPDSQLVLVGSSELKRIRQNSMDARGLSYVSEIDRMIKESGATDRVHVFGQMEDVETYMRAADLFVFPSHLEGSPNAVSESMACGLPCILTHFDGLSSELGQTNKEYSLAEFSSESIARQVCDLLENRSKREAMSKASREFALDHFNVEDTLDQYAQMYASLVKRPK